MSEPEDPIKFIADTLAESLADYPVKELISHEELQAKVRFDVTKNLEAYQNRLKDGYHSLIDELADQFGCDSSN